MRTVSEIQESIRALKIPEVYPQLSFVVPVYGAPECLHPLAERLAAVCATLELSYELILVDDRCPKNSWTVLETLAGQDPMVIAVRLSRNFGQHAAIQAGLVLVRGEWVVVMDCDLQDRPEELPKLLAKAAEGFDVICAERSVRQDPWHRRFLSRSFYWLLSTLTGTHQSPEVANFGVYRRKVIDVVRGWPEESKYFPAIIQWVGFARTGVEISHSERPSGKSSYTFVKLLRLATSVIIGFSDRPLKYLMVAGLFIATSSMLLSLVILISYLVGFFTVEGWASIVLSLWFLGGSLLFALGLTGLYVGRILVEVKGRPTFIVDEVLSAPSAGARSSGPNEYVAS